MLLQDGSLVSLLETGDRWKEIQPMMFKADREFIGFSTYEVQG